MAGNPILKAQKLPEQILAIRREIRKIRTTLRPANRRRQRHRQHFQQIVTARIARSRIAKIIKRRGKPGHGYPPYYEGHPKNPYQLIALLYFQMRFRWPRRAVDDGSFARCGRLIIYADFDKGWP